MVCFLWRKNVLENNCLYSQSPKSSPCGRALVANTASLQLAGLFCFRAGGSAFCHGSQEQRSADRMLPPIASIFPHPFQFHIKGISRKFTYSTGKCCKRTAMSNSVSRNGGQQIRATSNLTTPVPASLYSQIIPAERPISIAGDGTVRSA